MTRYIVTGVLIAVFAALLAYVKFYEKGEVPKAGEEKPITVLSIEKTHIRRLEWRYPDRKIACSRSGRRWVFEAPAGVRLDRDKLDAVLDGIADLEASREIGGGANPADFGLDKPRLELEIGLAGGKNVTILASDEAPTEGKTYLSLAGGGRVLLADTWRVDQIKKTESDLRDMSVIQFDRDGVKAVAVESGGGETARCVRNKKGEWKLEGRKKSCESEASAILSTLKYAEVKEFVPPEAGGDAIGPEKEIYVLKLELEGNKNRIIKLGERNNEDMYIKNINRNEIYKISGALAKDVKELLELAGVKDEKEQEDGTAEASPH